MAKKNVSTVNTGNYDYKTTKIRDPKTGRLRFSASNGDAVAKAMLVHTAEGGTIKQVVSANGLKVKDGGNPGCYRMSIGVALRGLVRNGTPVKIGSLTVKTLKQPIVLPKVEAAPAPRKAKKASKATARKAKAEPAQAAA